MERLPTAMRRGFLLRLAFALEVLIFGIPDPPPCPWEPAPPPRDAAAGHFPDDSPLSSDEGSAAAREAALLVLHEDTYGFLLLSVRREDDELMIHMDQKLDETWWPAMAATLERLAAAVPR